MDDGTVESRDRGVGDAVCVHCRTRERGPFRGLCSTCYNTTLIRRLYPEERGEGRGKGSVAPEDRCKKITAGAVDALRSVAASRPGRRLPLPTPTDAVPGSQEKKDVIAARLARGEALFHPLDAAMDKEGDDRNGICDGAEGDDE